MKFAIIVSRLSNGGAERVAARLSDGINQINGNSCELILLNPGIDYQCQSRMHIIHPSYQAGDPVIKKAIFHLFLYAYRVKKLKKQQKYDIVVSFNELPNLVNIRSRDQEQIIVSIRSYFSLHYAGRNELKIKKLLREYEKADRIIAVSADSARDLIINHQMDREKVDYIYNPYDIPAIEALSRENLDDAYEKIFAENKVIICAGRISEDKAFWRGIKALKLLKDRGIAVKLIIFGREIENDKQTNRLIELIERYHLQEEVIFGGFQKNIFKYLSKADIFLLMSKLEGFPNVLVEAMICGLPVVSVDCRSGPREIIAPNLSLDESIGSWRIFDNGILFKQYGDDEDIEKINRGDEIIADCVAHLFDHPEVAADLIHHARIRVQEFSSPAIIKQWIEIGSLLMSKSGRP